MFSTRTPKFQKWPLCENTPISHVHRLLPFDHAAPATPDESQRTYAAGDFGETSRRGDVRNPHPHRCRSITVPNPPHQAECECRSTFRTDPSDLPGSRRRRAPTSKHEKRFSPDFWRRPDPSTTFTCQRLQQPKLGFRHEGRGTLAALSSQRKKVRVLKTTLLFCNGGRILVQPTHEKRPGYASAGVLNLEHVAPCISVR